MTERDIQNDIETLRRAFSIMKILNEKYKIYFTHCDALTLETAIELEEEKPCTCGHFRWEHAMGSFISPQCRRCRCDRFDVASSLGPGTDAVNLSNAIKAEQKLPPMTVEDARAMQAVIKALEAEKAARK